MKAPSRPSAISAIATAGLLLTLLSGSSQAQDLIELTSGLKIRGAITARNVDGVTINVTVGTRSVARKYPLKSIHALTIGTKREVINPLAGAAAATAASQANKPAGETRRTRQEVEVLIAEVGRTPPAWFQDTPLNPPATLDLAWPHQPFSGWNNQKNVGQYVWDIVNPNPGRWREGVRLMHHLLTLNKSNPEVVQRAMLELGRMYHDLLEDYARSAFWYRAVGAEKDPQEYAQSAVTLAECYWRLGNREMAVELLGRVPTTYSAVKLWADLGETDKAIQLAEEYGEGEEPDLTYLYVGDACRIAGRYPEAIAYYQKVLDAPNDATRPARVNRNRQRAKASQEAIQLFDTLDVKTVADGKYQATSLGYEGGVQVEVAVARGRIDSVRVTQHREKQFYSALTDTPQKIIAKQDVRGVDATSGATITSEAIINATAKALAGKRK
jgi:uncharacterized protein with FMN-binding domain